MVSIVTARPGDAMPRAGRERRAAGNKKPAMKAGFLRIWQPRMDSNHRMPESESGALPLGDGAVELGSDPVSRRILALRELGCTTRLVQADLLALDFAGVAGHEAGLAQLRLQRVVILDQRTGDAPTDRTGLAGGAAAGNGDVDVELVGRLGQLERLAHDHARGLAAEELVDRALVDGDLAIALAQVDAGGGGLAAAGAVILLDCHVGTLD